VNATKTYEGVGVCLLSVASFRLRTLYDRHEGHNPTKKKLGGPHSSYKCFEEDKLLVRLLQIDPKVRFGVANTLCSISEASHREDVSQSPDVSTRMPCYRRLST